MKNEQPNPDGAARAAAEEASRMGPRSTLTPAPKPAGAVTQLAYTLPADLSTWPESPMKWRWDFVARMSGVAAHHGRYFAALDEATDSECVLNHPALAAGEGAKRLQQMGQIAGALQKRIQLRAQDKLDGPLFRLNSAELSSVRAAVVQWSRIQLDLLVAYYGSGEGAFDLDAVESAYLMFASGELRVPLADRRGIGEADSAFYFAWAEFALLASELGIDAKSWDSLLRPLVWTQGVFVHMQRPMGQRPHRFQEYGPRGRERVFTLTAAADARAKVRHANTRAELTLVHTANCKDAFA